MTGAPFLFYYVQVEKEGQEWLAKFPDLPHLRISGKTFWHVLARAEEALDADLEEAMRQKGIWPSPTDLQYTLGCFPIQVRRSLIEAYFKKEKIGP